MDEPLRDQVADLLHVLGNTPMSKADCYATADAILAIFAGLRVREQREAFVAGWGACKYEADNGDRLDGSEDPDVEAKRRYPDA